MSKKWNPFKSPIIRQEWHKKIMVTPNGGECPGQCTLWMGWNNCRENPYGKVRVGGVIWYLHRYVYAQYHRVKLTQQDVVDHRCSNHACFNPLHLKLAGK